VSCTVSETMISFRVSEPMVPMFFGVLETIVSVIFVVSNSMVTTNSRASDDMDLNSFRF